MLSILFGFGFLVAGTGIATSIASTMSMLVPLVLLRENMSNKANEKVGINTTYEKFADEKGLASSALMVFQFQAKMLPEAMHYLLQQKWILTAEELLQLFTMARQEMLTLGQGPYSEKMQGLCETYGIPYQELIQSTKVLELAVVKENGAHYEKLRWISNNRAADPRFKKLLDK